MNLATILLLSVYVLHVPVAGSLWWLIGVSLLFIFVSVGTGVAYLVYHPHTGGCHAHIGFGFDDAYDVAERYDFPGREYAASVACDFRLSACPLVIYKRCVN